MQMAVQAALRTGLESEGDHHEVGMIREHLSGHTGVGRDNGEVFAQRENPIRCQ